MLRRIELEVLATVDRGDTISELATKLDHSESYLSRAVANLVEKGLVYAERDSRRKRVAPSDARAVELYRDLVRQHSHIEFPELLTGKALEVCTTSTSREPSPRSPTGATTTATRSTASSSGFVIVVLSGRPTATTSSTPTSTASTSSPVNLHTICIGNDLKPSPRRGRSSGGTTTNSSPKPRRRSTQRRSTKPASLDSRPSTSSSYSPVPLLLLLRGTRRSLAGEALLSHAADRRRQPSPLVLSPPAQPR